MKSVYRITGGGLVESCDVMRRCISLFFFFCCCCSLWIKCHYRDELPGPLPHHHPPPSPSLQFWSLAITHASPFLPHGSRSFCQTHGYQWDWRNSCPGSAADPVQFGSQASAVLSLFRVVIKIAAVSRTYFPFLLWHTSWVWTHWCIMGEFMEAGQVNVLIPFPAALKSRFSKNNSQATEVMKL